MGTCIQLTGRRVGGRFYPENNGEPCTVPRIGGNLPRFEEVRQSVARAHLGRSRQMGTSTGSQAFHAEWAPSQRAVDSWRSHSLAVPPKAKDGVTLCCSNSAPRYIPKGTVNRDLNRHVNTRVHSCTIYSSQMVGIASVPITDEWTNKMWSIRTMEYYSAIQKDEVLTYATT